ncbi:MAG: hypothetical protein HC915_00290 [Anaerolineae bacterium]|nr:hypothetical protein [Anaerolineae bacterium]
MKWISLWMLSLVLVLAACEEDTVEVPAPQPRATTAPAQDAAVQQPPPVVTRVITRTPVPSAPGAVGAATIDPALAAYAGAWTLILRHDVFDSVMGDQLTYSASATVNVGLDGSVSGAGIYSQNLVAGNCPTEVLNEEAPSFAVLGQLRDLQGQPTIDLTLQPINLTLNERYRVRCFEPDTGFPIDTDTETQFLWNALIVANLLSYSFSLDGGGSG